jgi:quercetin dioxygenase-like cupin family protein
MRRLASVRIGCVGAIAIAVGPAIVLRAAAQEKPAQRSRVAIAQALPAMDGSHLEATVVEVEYEPGGMSATHRHPCPVIGYVLEGSVRMQVKGQPERTYSAGETFFETPADVHAVSANGSRDKTARFLAYFVCDHKTPLSIPVTGAGAREP